MSEKNNINLIAVGLAPYVPEVQVPSNVEVRIMEIPNENASMDSASVFFPDALTVISPSVSESTVVAKKGECLCTKLLNQIRTSSGRQLEELARMHCLPFIDLITLYPDVKPRRVTNLGKLKSEFVVQNIIEPSRKKIGRIIRGEKGCIRPFIDGTVTVTLPVDYMFEFISYMQKANVEFASSCMSRGAVFFLLYLNDVPKIADYLKLRRRKRRTISQETRERLKERAAKARQARALKLKQ